MIAARVDTGKMRSGEGILKARERRVMEATWMKFGKLAAILLAASVIAGCGSGSSTPVTVTISSSTSGGGAVGHVTVVRTGTQQFNATVAGISNTLVTWEVCDPAPAAIATGSSTAPNIVLPTGCVAGGNTILGAITTNGLYTGPATLPPNSEVSVVAVAQGKTSVFAITDVTIDSGVRVSLTPSAVTVGTGEQFQFSATVSGSTNTAVNWTADFNGSNGASSTGTITPTACTASMPITPSSSNPVPPGTTYGCYTAPAATPQSAVTITATAAADTSQAGTATVTVVAATDPSFSTNIPLEPAATVEGAVQQDVNLFGNNFFSTNQVLVNGAPVATTFVNSTTLRATIPAGFFSGPSPSGLPITVERQNGDTIQPVSLGVNPMRPAVIASSPDSFPTSTLSGTLTINGGYFSSSTQASSEGAALPVTVMNSRQLQVGLSGSTFATPGLIPVLIQNADVPSGSPALSSTNVAIAPSASNIPTAANPPITVGTQPIAVGIDTALGVAAVVDQGSNQVSLLNLDTGSAPVNLPVGKTPTSVGVDDILHLAAVVNSADNSLSIVNLQTQGVATVALPANPTGSSPSPAPYAIGVNSLTHRAVIAYSSSNIATVFDLSTNPPSLVCTMGGSDPTMPNNCSAISGSNTRPVSTGPNPAIAVEPQLNWAIVTPGGSGTNSIVDLGSSATANQVARVPNVVASLNAGSLDIRGVAINTETEQALLVDPNTTRMTLFSILDQDVASSSASQGFTAAAINPLTDVGVAVNSVSSTASVIDLRTLKQLVSVSVGASPQAVAVDPGKNVAVIANAGDNTVSILSLGAIRTPQIIEVSPPIAFAAPSAGALTVTVNGFGFSSGSQVRLDGVAVPTSVSSNGRQAIATVPGSMLSAARRFTLDVANTNGSSSNVKRFLVIGTVPIGVNPIGVAIDPDLNEALVTSQGPVSSPTNTCTSPGSVSVVNLSNATVSNSFGVGSCPEGVAVIPRLGLGVIANNDSQNASVLDYVNGNVTATISTQLDPVGVAIAPDTGETLVTNSSSNTVTTFTVSASGSNTSAGSIPVDQVPFGVAVDPIDGIAAITASSQNTVDTLTLGSSFLAGRVSGFEDPSDVAFDPITDTFLVADSLANQIGIVDPKAAASGIAGFTPFRVGIDPTALAYNFQSGTGVTFNQASNTFSIFNFLATNPNSTLTIQTARVEVVLPIGGSVAFSVAINPLTNVAAVVDQANGRLLLVPLP